MSTEIDIRLITAKDTLPLRHKVLKPFLATDEECALPGDDLPTTFHMGLFIEGRLLSICTFMHEAHPDLPAENAFRLRGMATDDNYRGQGLGHVLLSHVEDYLREKKKCDFLWFNARIKAFSFYEKLGFSYYGPLFDMKDIGPHKVMYKKLLAR